MKNMIIVVLWLALVASLIVNAEMWHTGTFISTPSAGQLIEMSGQALVTNKHVLVESQSGQIYDLSDVRMDQSTEQAIVTGENPLFTVAEMNGGRLSIKQIQQVN